MVSITQRNNGGFTAVELLITLFVASIFLFAGYQLYTQVIRDGQEAASIAEVSNLAYERMQNSATTVSEAYPNGCVSASQSGPTNVNSTVPGIGTVTFATTISCPRGTAASADLFLVKVKATYSQNGAQQELEHATYTN